MNLSLSLYLSLYHSLSGKGDGLGQCPIPLHKGSKVSVCHPAANKHFTLLCDRFVQAEAVTPILGGNIIGKN